MLLSPFNKASSPKLPQLLPWNNKQMLQAPIFPVFGKRRVAAFINPKWWGLFSSFLWFILKEEEQKWDFLSGDLDACPWFIIVGLQATHCLSNFQFPFSKKYAYYFTLLTLYQCCKKAMKWYAWKMYKYECWLASLLKGVFSLSLILSFDRYLFLGLWKLGFSFVHCYVLLLKTPPHTWSTLIKYWRKWMDEGIKKWAKCPPCSYWARYWLI